ncbi:MAG: ribosome silencing factor [Deltaproteobacteria bacterium]|jgi:ribosome-associated protein|nr:ribosome silencing factor [Deltaproteobacteria bacterium]
MTKVVIEGDDASLSVRPRGRISARGAPAAAGGKTAPPEKLRRIETPEKGSAPRPPKKKTKPDPPKVKSSAARRAELESLKAGMGPEVRAARKTRVSRRTPPESRDLAALVSRAALEHKVSAPVLINLAGISQVADFFYIASLDSSRQVKSVAEKIVLRVKEAGGSLLGVEGLSAADVRWALIDLGDVIVHLFQPEARALYDLEGLWADAPRVDPATLGGGRRKLKI